MIGTRVQGSGRVAALVTCLTMLFAVACAPAGQPAPTAVPIAGSAPTSGAAAASPAAAATRPAVAAASPTGSATQAAPTQAATAAPATAAALTAAAPASTAATPTLAAAASPTAAASAAAAASPATAATVQPTPVPRSGSDEEVILATTTSTQDSGLLDVLVPMFEEQSGYQVKTVSVGSGAALALGARGEADVVLVHAPQSELKWMADGNGTERLLVMHNDFVIVGPADDPARIEGMQSAVEAMKTIAAAGAPFVSRGDNSGTNQLELNLWKQASIDPKGQAWYVESGSGMGQTLTIADQKQAYTITDRGTWLSRQDQLELPVLVERDRALLNVYHVMPVSPAKFPNVKINAAGGKAFADFMVAPETQAAIGEFGIEEFGEALFVPDAGKDEENLAG